MIKLTKKEREFVDNYAKYGGNYTEICRAMGLKARGYEHYMRLPQVKEYLQCSMERARESLVAAVPHVTDGLIKMYNCDKTDDKIKVMIAQQILDRAGLVADRNINLNMNINTSLSMRARQLLQEKLTIETTASPVTERLPDVLEQGKTMESQSVLTVEKPVTVQELT